MCEIQIMINRIKQLAENHRKADGQMRLELAERADAVWSKLRAELAAFQTSEMSLVSEYLTGRSRQYRTERSLAELTR